MQDVIKDREYYDNMMLDLSRKFSNRNETILIEDIEGCYFEFIAYVYGEKYYKTSEWDLFIGQYTEFCKTHSMKYTNRFMREYLTPDKLNELGY